MASSCARFHATITNTPYSHVIGVKSGGALMYRIYIIWCIGYWVDFLYKDNRDISLNRASFSTLSTTLACNEDTSYTPIGVHISALVSAGSM